MLELVRSLLATGSTVALYVILGIIITAMLLVMLTVSVALFHPDPNRQKNARAVLRELRGFFRDGVK